MENDKQEWGDIFFLVSKLIILGLLGGFIGMTTFAALTPPRDLGGDMWNAMVAGFFTMIATITVVVYLHNRQKEKNKSK